MQKRRQPEYELHKAIIEFLRYSRPKLLYFHCPNGGQRNPISGAKFKAMGVLAGVADILLFKDGCFYAVELKAGKNTQEDTQIDFMNRWVSEGGKYAVCRSIDEMKDILQGWGI